MREGAAAGFIDARDQQEPEQHESSPRRAQRLPS